MALLPVSTEKAVGRADDDMFKTPMIPKKRKKVLEEEVYTEELEKIIQRDFFPDLKKLQAQNEYLDAEARNDVAKIRQLQMQYRPTPKRPNTSASSVGASPLTFETPSTFETLPSPLTRAASKDSDPLSKDSNPVPPKTSTGIENQTADEIVEKKVGLDAYLTKVTSEDNASFDEVMEESDKKHRSRYPWLYEEDQSKKFKKPMVPALAIKAEGNQALMIEYEEMPNSVDTWDYRARNNVMNNPEGAEFTAAEQEVRDTQKIIVQLHNTRFKCDPWKDVDVSPDTSAVAALGKIGPDGKEILPNATPKMNGYSFMPSPSPMPGVGESPMMTWGEIEGTPFALDASDTMMLSRTPGPQFKIPDVPERDRLHLELVDTVGRRHRVKREKALESVRSLAATTPKFGSALSQERLAGLSPAAQRLATKRLGIRLGTDKVLSASYTPSPKRSSRTPIGSSRGSVTPIARTPGTPSITDNLLDIRKPASSGK